MNNNNVSLTDKLQGLSATLRRERDDAFRQQSLAAERLAAIQQEEQALGKTVAQQQTKLAHLRAGGNVATDITTCRVQVQALKQQVRAEVQGSNNRIARFQALFVSLFFRIDSYSLTLCTLLSLHSHSHSFTGELSAR